MRCFIFSFFCLFSVFSSLAQNFTPQDVELSLRNYFSNYRQEGYVPTQRVGIDRVVVNDTLRVLVIYPNEAFCSQSFTPSLLKKIYKQIETILPPPYNTYSLQLLTKDAQSLEMLIPNVFREEGADVSRLWGQIKYEGTPWLIRSSKLFNPTKGLKDRHLMIWSSHGRYYKYDKWQWQRPLLFSTTEDLLTQSFVTPFLIPMLENAGAIVYSAKERDSQREMVIVDNDGGESKGCYIEKDAVNFKWESLSPHSGFALYSPILSEKQTPFTNGTARQIVATTQRTQQSTATWIPRIPKSGEYAVYVSYASLPNSVDDAHYTVFHKGGRTEFVVNQQIGGGTWLYLGTFEFTEGETKQGRVQLSNFSQRRGVVTSDAVRFGGGIGMVSRESAGVSGLPCYLEGARYYTQWSGLPDTLFSKFGGSNDYSDDIRSRSELLNNLAGGSVFLPNRDGKRVPFELSLALHSDAGVKYDDSVYGTLSIYTSIDDEGNAIYPSGLSRMASADLASLLVANIEKDLSNIFNTNWNRREVWDRNYGETRTPAIPSAILEMFSHQNFTDMRYAHDPLFKFHLSRSVYKSVLQHVNASHGIRDFILQPLPPRAFAAVLKGDSVLLSWKESIDKVNPNSLPKGYIVYTKIGDEAFDNGQFVASNHFEMSILPRVKYAFRITAVNEGGESFPSETLAVFSTNKKAPQILLINAFTRVSGPAVINTADSLGFDLLKDPGVPYLSSLAYPDRSLTSHVRQ